MQSLKGGMEITQHSLGYACLSLPVAIRSGNGSSQIELIKKHWKFMQHKNDMFIIWVTWYDNLYNSFNK